VSVVSWEPYRAGASIGEPGSEDGTIVRDEEHAEGARITIERLEHRSAAFAITCGVYGWMVHTRYFGDEQSAIAGFESMKAPLAHIVDAIPRTGEAGIEEAQKGLSLRIEAFIQRFP
jgi:hypothetical protein